MTLSFEMPYATGKNDEITNIPVNVELFGAGEYHDHGFTVSYPSDYYNRPSWAQIHNYMLANELFDQMPLGAVQNRQSNSYSQLGRCYYVINY